MQNRTLRLNHSQPVSLNNLHVPRGHARCKKAASEPSAPTIDMQVARKPRLSFLHQQLTCRFPSSRKENASAAFCANNLQPPTICSSRAVSARFCGKSHFCNTPFWRVAFLRGSAPSPRVSASRISACPHFCKSHFCMPSFLRVAFLCVSAPSPCVSASRDLARPHFCRSRFITPSF